MIESTMDAKDRLWECLEEELVAGLTYETCLDSHFCKDLANDVVNSIRDSLIDEIFTTVTFEVDEVLVFLETLRRWYYPMLGATEQRDLERLLTKLRP